MICNSADAWRNVPLEKILLISVLTNTINWSKNSPSVMKLEHSLLSSRRPTTGKHQESIEHILHIHALFKKSFNISLPSTLRSYIWCIWIRLFDHIWYSVLISLVRATQRTYLMCFILITITTVVEEYTLRNPSLRNVLYFCYSIPWGHIISLAFLPLSLPTT